jgi:LysM repeat protein
LEVGIANGGKRILTTASSGVAEIRPAGPGKNRLSSSVGGAVLARTLAFAGTGPSGGGGSGPDSAGVPLVVGALLIARVEEYKVKAGDTLAKIAADNGLTERELATFNWGVSAPTDIERALRDQVGCTEKTKEGKYALDDTDEPGILYFPKPWSESGLAGGKRHVIRVKRIVRRLPDLKFWYQIDTDAPEAKNDTLTLETEDGSWKHEIPVSGHRSRTAPACRGPMSPRRG